MASIVIRKMGGMAPSANAQALDPGVATLARNHTLRFGDFRPLRQPQAATTVTAGSTLYRMETAGGFITRPGTVNFVRGPIATDATERTYYTGDGAPKVTDLSGQVRQLGVPMPGAAPNVQINAVAQYSTDDQVAAVGAAALQFANLVGSTLDHPYVGITSAALGANYIDGSFAFLSSLRIPGSLVNGAFKPTNPALAVLMDDRLGFYLRQVGSAIEGGVDLTVRGMIAKVGTGMPAALATIKDPTDPSKQLMTAAQITSAVSAITDALKPADTVLADSTSRLTSMTNEFTQLATGGSTATAGQVSSVATFYQRAEVVSAITAAVNRAAYAVRDAISTYHGT